MSNQALPVDVELPALMAALQAGNAAIVVAPPGAGKTTRVPPALLAADWLGRQRVVMLEPRRLAARAAARFMARTLGEAPGGTVGYRTRLETRVSGRTRIEVVTEGILTRMLQADPALSGVGAVVFDEFHERSLNADLGLALVRDAQQALRDDLRVVVMSATLETGRLATLLDDAPVLVSEGRAHPVDVEYRPPRRGQRAVDAAAAGVREMLRDESGSILVFLPGAGEIRAVAARLADGLPDDVDLRALHGALPAAAQDAAIAPAPDRRRKVVLATAIAETSLTIEGIRVIIDAGLERRARFDPGAGMTRLVTTRVSRAAAEQRAGRAGRLARGRCIRLWSASQHKRLAAFSPPEIVAADLAGLVLELAGWGVHDPAMLAWLDPPPRAHWNQAIEVLTWLDALDDRARITAHGRAMLELGIHPRAARMLLYGRRHGAGRRAACLAALLSERDPLGPEAGADIESRLAVFDRAQGARGTAALRKLAGRLVAGQADRNDGPGAGALLAQAFPDRIAMRRPGGPARYLLSGGRGAWLPDDDPLAGREWLVAAALDGTAREARIFLAAAIERAGVEDALAGHIETRSITAWDAHRGCVVARRERRLGALVLDTQEARKPSPLQYTQGLLDAVAENGLPALNWTDTARQFCARVELLRRVRHPDWPRFDAQALLEARAEWLGPFLAGMTHWHQLARLDLVPALQARLGQARLGTLDRLAPSHIETPAGLRARLDYTAQAGPVLAVKLQAVFGWRQIPRIADGRARVVLHLLDPAGRPLAVTADLESFWKRTYPEVARNMRGRYPKHPWPDDPLSARAGLGTRRR